MSFVGTDDIPDAAQTSVEKQCQFFALDRIIVQPSGFNRCAQPCGLVA